MSHEADRIIDGLGGTSAVAKLVQAPTSTVHSWRKIGIPASRLDHLKLAAKRAKKPWPASPPIAAQASPALCTVCDHRLDDVAIRSCSVLDCPNAQRDAA